MSENKKSKQSAYEQQESRLSAQSVAFIKLLTQRGILGDAEIDDDKIRQAQKEKKRHTYHNTEMLLQHYKDIVWALECFPSTIVEELDRPLDDLDALISYVDVEMSLDNRKLESRIESIKKSRLLLDRVNDALTILKKKPDNGEKMYELIYLTYIAPEKLSHSELLYGQLAGISTIVAVTAAAVALLVRMISRNQRAVDEATSWIKRIVVAWIVLNSLGFVVAYLQPLVSGGQYTG